MRLDRLGASTQNRLSFMRVLLRRAAREQWTFARTRFDLDASGVGVALYEARTPERTYTLIAFAHDLDPAMRTDRVIATAWDATFTLFDGVPTAADIERVRSEVPRQEAGHVSERELILARANRSVRLFEHVCDCLAEGRQPALDALQEVGYLMRTTAVYGSGKFGLADRMAVSERAEFHPPFQAELLAVFLIRWFTVDIVEHLAAERGGATACKLAGDRKRTLGVGNSTGLGMAPFVVNHPALMDRWFTARETALARVRGMPDGSEAHRDELQTRLRQLSADAALWNTDDSRERERIQSLRTGIAHLVDEVARVDLTHRPWDTVYRFAERSVAVPAQEALVGALLELYPELIDSLAERMGIDESSVHAIDGGMRLGELRHLLSTRYQFAARFDFASPEQSARFWYTSEEKLEPRLGERYEEPGAELEHPLAVARDAGRLADTLSTQGHQLPDDGTVAELLAAYPEFRHIVRRVQVSASFPYAEVRDNLIGASMMPVDLLRAKLSFFGATRFDPRSDRWIRINMFQRAPFPDEMPAAHSDDWPYMQLSEGIGVV